MTPPNEPPGISPLTAALALVAMLVVGVVIAVGMTVASSVFQRMQDRRLTQPPSRTEWLRVGLALWLRSIVDAFARRSS